MTTILAMGRYVTHYSPLHTRAHTVLCRVSAHLCGTSFTLHGNSSSIKRTHTGRSIKYPQIAVVIYTIVQGVPFNHNNTAQFIVVAMGSD